MKDFVCQHRQAYGVKSICKVLQIAPSGYWRHAASERNHPLRCALAKQDNILVFHIERVWQTNMRVYDEDKVWKQMNTEGLSIVRCPLYGRAVDEVPGLARRAPWQSGTHQYQ